MGEFGNFGCQRDRGQEVNPAGSLEKGRWPQELSEPAGFAFPMNVQYCTLSTVCDPVALPVLPVQGEEGAGSSGAADLQEC